MNDFQNIKKLLIPLLKGSPIIALCIAIAVMLGYRSVMYTNPTYESTAKIRLDDIGHGISSSSLYEDFDVFSNVNKIETEVEVIKSKMLIEKTVKNLNWQTSYFRKGKVRTRELFNDCPFAISITSINENLKNQPLEIQIVTDNTFLLTTDINNPSNTFSGSFNKNYKLDNIEFTINKNEELLNRKKEQHLIGKYQVIIHSLEGLVDRIILPNLDVTAADKDVAVVRLSFKSEVPEKTTQFVNTLAETYISDYVDSRRKAAGKTVLFIDEQLKVISQKLAQSEINLEQYKKKNDVINLRQESETDLRKIAQLKIQLANLLMNETALDSLNNYINNPDVDFHNLAPNFQMFNDLLSTEMIKKIGMYQAEKKDLLIKYTPNEQKVKVVDQKINDLVKYIKESISNSKRNITIKRKGIEASITESQKVFENLPTKEREILILKREFELNQKIFNFLTEKKTDADIAQAAHISFHRVIERAYKPLSPTSPKKELTLIIATLLGFITGIIIIYSRKFIGGKISTKSDLETASGLSVIGIIKKMSKKETEENDSFYTLATNIKLLNNLKKHDTITVTSTLKGEGKSFTAHKLAKAFAAMNWKTIIVDLNLKKPTLHEAFKTTNAFGIEDIIYRNNSLEATVLNIEPNLSFLPAGTIEKHSTRTINTDGFNNLLNELKEKYDLVILDTSATTISLDATSLMKASQHSLYVIKADFTKGEYLTHADILKEKYDIKNLKLILNGVHAATSLNGEYTGSQFEYNQNNSFKATIKRYFKFYF